MKRLLIIAPSNSSFVRQDIEGLSRSYEVLPFFFGKRKAFQMVFGQLMLAYWLIRKTKGSFRILVWFADYHSLLPIIFGKVFGKKVFIIIGGYDGAKLKKYNYGGHVKAIRSWFIKVSCKGAYKILPVSSFVLKSLQENLPNVSLIEKANIIHNGIDTSLFSIGEIEESSNGVICVSIADTLNRYFIKGLDTFLNLARSMPNENFLLVGISRELLDLIETEVPNNCTIVHAVKREELRSILISKKVICQLSRFESFGLALAEGMLCGCIPLTFSDLGSAEVVGEDIGFVVSSREISEIKLALEKALDSPVDKRINARRWVIENFSLDRRISLLLEELEN